MLNFMETFIIYYNIASDIVSDESVGFECTLYGNDDLREDRF